MTSPQTYPYPQARQFASQLPVERTRLSHALRSEWTKIWSVRSTMWTLGVMLVLVIGINLLIVVPIANSSDTSVPVLAPGLFGLLLGQLAVITLGVLVISSEYGTGMIRTTFTSCPQRSRVLAAKAIVFFAVSFVTTTVACLVTAVVSWSVTSGKDVLSYDGDSTQPGVVIRDGVTTASGSEWLGATVGVGLYVALLGLLALAVGTLLRHSAGAVTTMLGVVLLPLLVAIFLPDSLDSLRENLIRFSSPNSLASLYRIPMIGSDDQTGLLQLIVLACVTAATLGAAFVTVNVRDV
ncbi:ABC transporter permease subunit [Actinacidiphila sp. ITFR-21]|uniref:ABC transporter permease subunit n=1 Tax=Actinacidiphila sp. ITFR-21 TaxID=3075199 RepID=UPI00288B147A|nr:ABC transporter permease subunit [Streptomyces sp. ITFR-21]WNI18151.1 ABC transporter permease subunit [Streptomyces sp. ITFR-21]